MNDILRRLVEKEVAGFFAHAQRADVSSTPSTLTYSGPGSLFGALGLENEVLSTSVQPRSVADMLPVRPSVVMEPLYPYLTGFINDNAGDISFDGPCDDPPNVGHGKSCYQTARFGKYGFQTRVLDITQPGRQTNRGQFMDLRLVNPPFARMDNSVLHPNIAGTGSIQDEVFFRMLELGIEFQRTLSRQLYQGNPANSSGTPGGYAEFPGLDLLINTGKIDALTQTPCPSLDSLIIDYGGAAVDLNGGDNLVNVLSYMMRYFMTLAENTNVSPVRWVLAMREQLFYEITAVWPCAYMTYRCQPRATDGTITQMITPSDQIAMRDAMREGKYLRIDGMDFDVVFDDAIVSTSVGGGCFTSDIYFLPMTIRNGTLAALFWEHIPYDRTALPVAEGMRVSQYFSTDGGRFLWFAPPPTNMCVQLRSWIEPRIILRTPHLAGRLLNVRYCPLINPREPYPDDDYFVNGGFYGVRTVPTTYSNWLI